MRLFLVLALLGALTGYARAQDRGSVSGEKAAFYAALAQAQAGEADAAEKALVALEARAPADLFADDALLEAARLDDEVLGRPARAAELYEALVARHPDSRLALRAERRARALRLAMGPEGRDTAAFARWQDILMHYPERGALASIAMAHQLLVEVPTFGQAAEVHLWLAERLAQESEPDGALVELAELPGYDGTLARRARRLEAELSAARGKYAHARSILRQLIATTPASDAAQRASLDAALAELGHAELTFGSAVAAWILVAGLLALALWRLLRRGLRALWPPPTLALYAAPVAVLFIGAGQTENAVFARATLAVGSAMVLVSWLVGAGLGGPSLRPRGILAWGAGGALAMLACAYLTVYHLDLFDLLAHTLAYGPD